MPVILTTDAEVETWLAAPTEDALALQRPLPDGALKIIARGDRTGDPNGFTFAANWTSGMHVVYRGVDNDIHELYWQNGSWSVNDLTAGTNAPAAAGNHIDKFWWAPASTSSSVRKRAVKPSRDAKSARRKAPGEA
jgi:hypothetical protein